jgi:hypothetical protein
MVTLVVGVASGMRSAGRMAHQEYPVAIDIQFRCIFVRPSHNGGDVPGGFWVTRFRCQPVTGVDAHNPVVGKIIKNVCVDFLASVAAAFREGATMDEDQRRP